MINREDYLNKLINFKDYDYSDKESNNAKYADERLKLKSIEVIE